MNIPVMNDNQQFFTIMSTENGSTNVRKEEIMSKAIDVHSHYMTEEYLTLLHQHHSDTEDGWPPPSWNLEDNLDVMAQCDVERTVLALSSPHPFWDDVEESKKCCRNMNEMCAGIMKERPDQFAFCATIPLPDVDAAVEEAVYAMDVLGASGVKMATNARGQYLGAKELLPLYEELDKRNAVIILHPSRPVGLPDGIFTAGPIPLYEFLADTTRTVLDMIANNIPAAFPNIKIVVPHCGAFLPNVVGRVKMLQQILVEGGHMDPIDVDANVSRLYFDTAGTPVPFNLKFLLTITTPDHVMYGGDWPHTRTDFVIKNMEILQAFFDSEPEIKPYKEQILYDNAKQIFWPE